MKEKKYIMLRNPHDERYKVFKNIEEKYAPNAGCPLGDGKTIEDALESVSIFDIKEKDINMEWI